MDPSAGLFERIRPGRTGRGLGTRSAEKIPAEATRAPVWGRAGEPGPASGVGLGRPALVALAIVLMAGILAAYVLLLVEAWRGRVRLRTMLTVSAVSLAVSVAGPVLLSRDVFSYAAYARIYALHHRNPYALAPASFPRDPFVAVTSTQWLHVRSAYGPAFTLVSAAIVRVLARSPGHT